MRRPRIVCSVEAEEDGGEEYDEEKDEKNKEDEDENLGRILCPTGWAHLGCRLPLHMSSTIDASHKSNNAAKIGSNAC